MYKNIEEFTKTPNLLSRIPLSIFGNTRLTRRAGLRRRLAKNGLTLRGKNGTFSEKRDKKESKNGVRLDHSLYGDFSVFS